MKCVYTIDVNIKIQQIDYAKAKDCTTVLLSVIFHDIIIKFFGDASRHIFIFNVLEMRI